MVTKVSVILPTYNERGNIADLVEEIIKVVKKPYALEVLIIDDSSPDGTGEEAKKLSKKYKQVRTIIRQERGLASAILRGIKESKGDVVVAMDTDFSHPPSDIKRLLDGLKDSDAVFASRYVKGGSMHGDRIQYYLSMLFNYVVKIILNITILDSTSGFFAIKKKYVMGLNEKLFTGYGDYCYKIIYVLRGKIKVKEIPLLLHKE